MARIRFNNQSGVISDNPLTSGATTFNSSALSGFPAVAAPDYASIVFEPDTANEEVAWITAHTASSTTATVARGRESALALTSRGIQHVSGSSWKHGPTVGDYTINERGMYLPANWDEGIADALLNNATTPAWITLISHSIGGGGNSNPFVTNCYMGLLRTWFITTLGYTPYADFFHTSQNNVELGTSNGTPPITLSGTQASSPNGYGKTHLFTGNPTNPLVYAAPFNCIQVEALYYDLLAGTFNYQYNGGASTPVTLLGDGWQKRIQSNVTATGARTMTIVSQSADQLFVPLGFSSYYNTTGVGFARVAYGGASVHDWARTDQLPAEKMDFIQGRYLGGTTGFGFPVGGAMVIIHLDGNDLGNPGQPSGGTAFYGATADAFDYGLDLMCSAARRAYNPASGAPCTILFLLTNLPGPGSDTSPANYLLNVQNLALYHEIIKEKAARFNAGWIDFNPIWGPKTVAAGYTTDVDGGFHPTNAGHSSMATKIETALRLAV